MTEPVAYWHIPQLENNEPFVSFGPSASHIFESIPLYTAEQLHPRVKMTQAEFDEWHKLVGEVADLYNAVTEICDISPYPSLYCRFFDLQNEDTDKTRKKQVEFATLWGIFDEFYPEETIEIVPTVKWFVQIKNKNEPAKFLRKTEFNVNCIDYGAIKIYAKQFDTKEEAEKWTNPLTKAVQLPVEGE